MVNFTRFKCAICGKLTAGRLPRSGKYVGDGTFRYPRRHYINGQPCPGNIIEAEWIDMIEVKTNKAMEKTYGSNTNR